MKYYLATLALTLSTLPLIAQEKSEEASKPFLSGNLYSRIAVTYQHADDYHSGHDSFASSVFENNDGEYSFANYSLDLVYITQSGLYIGSGLYASSADVSTDGLGLGVPDTNSDVELREIPLAIGYDTRADEWQLRVEARYIFNVDDEFEKSFASALSDSVLLPATDGSDSLSLTFRVKRSFFDIEHSLLFGYQMFEDDVEHPIFPKFSLGDRYFIDYEASKVFGDLKLAVGHLYSQSDRTKGTPSAITGTAYLTEKPRYSELRVTATYLITPRFLADIGAKYIYSGRDAPKQETLYLGLAYIF